MKINFRIVATIIIFSSIIGLAVNYFSTKGIPLIAEKKTLQWADDSLFIKIDEPADDPVKPKEEVALKSGITNEKKDAGEKVNEEKKTDIKETAKEEKQEDPLPSEPAAINLQQAYKLYNQNILFIDAREKADYDYAHIRGAINIPFDHFDDYKHLLDEIDKSKTIVTYCGGTDCDLSILLGNLLFDSGYKKVFIFFGGWNDWLEAGYPTQSNLQEE
jgi:rhodanese-related sulfurtransferase